MGVEVGGLGVKRVELKAPNQIRVFLFRFSLHFLLLFLGLPQRARVCVWVECVRVLFKGTSCCLSPTLLHLPSPLAAVLATDSHKDLLKLINDHRMEVPEAGQGGNGKGVPRPGEVLGRRAVEQ